MKKAGLIDVNNRTGEKINPLHLITITERFLYRYGIKNKTVSIALVGDGEIKRMNKKCLGRDEATDVLAFPGAGDFFGEVIIGYGQVKKQAGRYDNTAGQELDFVLVHGLLHLLGHEDHTGAGKARMEKLGKEFLDGL